MQQAGPTTWREKSFACQWSFISASEFHKTLNFIIHFESTQFVGENGKIVYAWNSILNQNLYKERMLCRKENKASLSYVRYVWDQMSPALSLPVGQREREPTACAGSTVFSNDYFAFLLDCIYFKFCKLLWISSTNRKAQYKVNK